MLLFVSNRLLSFEIIIEVFMKTQKILGLTLLTLTLTACGSGGGGSGSSENQNGSTAQNQLTQPVTPSQPIQPAKPSQPAKPEQPKAEKPKDTITGIYRESFWGFDHDLSGNDINAIKVWGTEIQLLDPAMKSENGWLSDSVDKRSNRIVSDFLTNARLGLAIRSSEVVAFAQGKATPVENVPTLGSPSYKGQHILVVENSKEAQQETKTKYSSFRGEALFDVDFANKKITGSLELPKAENQTEKAYLPISADIKGNTFEKEAFFDGSYVKGKFYGENASEMAGVYQQRDKFSSAFGAKKENKK